jgi:hypothetical protein
MTMRRRAACSVFGVLVLVAQLGSGTPLQRSLDQIERSVTRPVPQAPPPPAARPRDTYVPDRYVSDPVDGRVILVPGHWERALPSGEYLAPPTTICGSDGACTTIPGGSRPATPEQRQTP